jgi:hypothetical protein
MQLSFPPFFLHTSSKTQESTNYTNFITHSFLTTDSILRIYVCRIPVNTFSAKILERIFATSHIPHMYLWLWWRHKTPTYLNGFSLASSHESFPHCSLSNSLNSITFPNYSLDLYHLTKTVQRSSSPAIHLITSLLNYSHLLLSWTSLPLPLCKILQPIPFLLCFVPVSEYQLCLYLVG